MVLKVATIHKIDHSEFSYSQKVQNVSRRKQKVRHKYDGSHRQSKAEKREFRVVSYSSEILVDLEQDEAGNDDLDEDRDDVAEEKPKRRHFSLVFIATREK